MISNPRSEVGRKVESRGPQIIRAIFSSLTPPSTVNSQQSRTVQPGNRYKCPPVPVFRRSPRDRIFTKTCFLEPTFSYS